MHQGFHDLQHRPCREVEIGLAHYAISRRVGMRMFQVAIVFGAVPAAVLGGVGTIAVALLWMKLFPTLRQVERLE